MTVAKTLLALCIFFLLNTSCRSPKKDFYQSLTGNWLLLAPKQLNARHDKDSTKNYEDSLTSLYGLKLLQLVPDGTFYELDSLWKPAGKWTFTKDSLLKIDGGGKGFTSFKARFVRLDDEELVVAQSLMQDGDELDLLWTLKKLDDVKEAAALFEPEKNNWRQKPKAAESEGELSKRLAAMLFFYGDYFVLVSTQANYFLRGRVPLPFTYYQHAIGIMQQAPAVFQNFFYDAEQAAKARRILEQTLRNLRYEFPDDKNFALEYGAFLKKMAAKLSGS